LAVNIAVKTLLHRARRPFIETATTVLAPAAAGKTAKSDLSFTARVPEHINLRTQSGDKDVESVIQTSAGRALNVRAAKMQSRPRISGTARRAGFSAIYGASRIFLPKT